MTHRQISLWIFNNLGPVIRQALAAHRGVIYTEDWLAAIAHREVFPLIARYVQARMKTKDMWELMKGDYSQRDGEREKSYHGFSPWQIDIGSFPEFVKSGQWKDPLKACIKAIEVLEGKRQYLQDRFPKLQDDALHRAITAAYNCGEGNVRKVLEAKQDIDTRTHNRDYSKAVWEYRALYRSIPDYVQKHL